MDSRKNEKRLAEVIADFVVRREFETLPPETVEKAKEFALDVIGCMIGSSKRPQINIQFLNKNHNHFYGALLIKIFRFSASFIFSLFQ